MGQSRHLFTAREITGIRWAVDTNVIDDREAIDLRRMAALEWIELVTTDTLLVEILGAKEDRRRDKLVEAAEPYIILRGPLVLGHSRLGLSVLGGDDDKSRHRAIHSALFAQADFDRDGKDESKKGAGRRRFRDAMHVATSIRYGLSGLITNDKQLLARARIVAADFDGFLILSPPGATARAIRAIAQTRKRAGIPGYPLDPHSLPDWP